MSIVQVCGFALLGVVTVLILRSFRPEYATVAGIAVGLILLAGTFSPLVSVLDSVTAIAESINLETDAFPHLRDFIGV